ncbi:zinc finger domain-containing protein [Streptomyces sp. NPDC001340]
MLPLEAIELDAFRKQYEGQTFWCGSWLGGCGRQLTTKLYVDRVCHFAHHPDTDTTRPPCARRARDVTSADHLYVKAAAEGLMRAQDLPGEVVCSQPGPELAPAGSVVQLQLGDGAGLTIHMNAAVPPDWDSPEAVARIVVEAGVPLDRATLQRLPYVHRIRCESQGTSRRVLIGTETARGTQWFTPEQCSLGPAGLVTPALNDLPDRPVARPPERPQAEKDDQPARITPAVRRLLLRLATARQGRDLATTQALIKECDGLLERRTPASAVLKQARDSAEQWLLERTEELVTLGRKGERVVLTGEAAKQEREKQERQSQEAAQQRQQYLEELELAMEQERFGDARALLRAISRLPHMRVPLAKAQNDLLQGARTRLYNGKLGLLQSQVSPKKWIQRTCPTCKATPGRECFDDVPEGQPLRRPGGHDERLLLVIASREKAAGHKRAQGGGGKPSHSSGTTTEDLARSVSHVSCPTCKAPVGRPCTVPGSHEARFWFAQAQRRP